MADDGPVPQRPRSRLWKAAEALHVFGILALVVGGPTALAPPLARGDWAGLGRGAAVGFGLPAAMLLGWWVLSGLAARRDRRRA
jgi:hypothetical protein